MALAWTENTG